MDLLSQINEQLNAEKWTRAALNNYTVSNFNELDTILDEVFESKKVDEIQELLEDHIQHAKNSIIALYLSGIIHLSKQAIDDSNIMMLIELFTENHRWNIVKYLAERVLSFGENIHALRVLSECHQNDGNEADLYATWERLIRVDYDEADIVKKLAEWKEAEGLNDESLVLYKKALHRYINKNKFPLVHEIWTKLLELSPNESEFFYHAEGKVSKSMGEDKSIQLLEDLYPIFQNKENWEGAIAVLKRILTYDPENPWARKEIIECFRNYYKDHSQLEEYIKLSNLSQNWRNVHEAILDFEKHISFDAGNFVFHREWGVGRIKGIKDDTININFVKKKNHDMSLKMAVSSLTILGKDHIWVYRLTKKKEVLVKRIKKDPVWALRIIIRSFDNAADIKKIKAELVPGILTQSEWSSWSTKARHVLKTDESFGNLPDKPDVYVVRDQPITLEEKTYNRFKAEKDFGDRLKTVLEFLKYIEDEDEPGSVETEMFREMFDYFINYAKNRTHINEHTFSSTLLVTKIVESFPFLNPGINLSFRDLVDSGSDLLEVYNGMVSPEIKRDFLTAIKNQIKTWPQIFITLLPVALQKDVLTALTDPSYIESLTNKFNEIYASYKELREAFIWVVKNSWEDDWLKNTGIGEEKLLIAMIHLLDLTARDIDNKKDVSLNRKLNKQILSFLFKDEVLAGFILSTSEDSLNRIFALLEDVKDLDPGIVRDIKMLILGRFPNFKFAGSTRKAIEAVSRGGFFATPRSFEERQKALQNLLEVEVPKNSKEIATARDFGDLKENAEYKAAKERQDILNSTAAKWKEEIEKAQIVRQNEVDITRVGFGTEISLLNHENHEKENYIILGPWESQPEKKILSHQSPFASELLNHNPGEELKFIINEREFHYTIEEIKTTDFSKIDVLKVVI